MAVHSDCWPLIPYLYYPCFEPKKVYFNAKINIFLAFLFINFLVQKVQKLDLILEEISITEGQLISKCPFGVIIWTKNQQKI